MKLQKKISVVLVLLISIIILFYSNVNAFSIGVKLSSDSMKLESFKEYTIILSTEELNVGEGIDTMMVNLKYDTEVFDENETSVSITNGWSPIYYKENGVILLERMKKTSENAPVLTIKLKTKNVDKIESTTLTLTDIEATGGIIENGGTGNLTIPSASITLDKQKPAEAGSGEIAMSDSNATEEQNDGSNQNAQGVQASENSKQSTTKNENSNNGKTKVTEQNSEEQKTQEKTSNEQTQTNENTSESTSSNKANSGNSQKLISSKTEKKKSYAGIIIFLIILAVATVLVVYFIKIKGKKTYK